MRSSSVVRSRRASVSSIRSITRGLASRKSDTSSGGTYRQRSGARATTSATVFQHDSGLPVHDHVQADVDLTAADDPLSFVERDLAHSRQQVLQLVASEIGEQGQARNALDECELRGHRA